MADALSYAADAITVLDAELASLAAAEKAAEYVLTVNDAKFGIPQDVAAPMVAKLIEAKTIERRALVAAVDLVAACSPKGQV